MGQTFFPDLGLDLWISGGIGGRADNCGGFQVKLFTVLFCLVLSGLYFPSLVLGSSVAYIGYSFSKY